MSDRGMKARGACSKYSGTDDHAQRRIKNVGDKNLML